jgi:hypothetical protein
MVLAMYDVVFIIQCPSNLNRNAVFATLALAAHALENKLSAAGIRVLVASHATRPQWLYSHYNSKIEVSMGERDLDTQCVILRNMQTAQKYMVAWTDLVDAVTQILKR